MARSCLFPGLLVAALVGAVVTPRPAAAQSRATPPRVCTISSPLDLAPTPRSTAVSIVIAGSGPSLFVLYTGRDAGGQESVWLLEIGGILGSDLELRGSRRIDAGYAMQGGLAVVGGSLVGAYIRADESVGVFARPIAGGAFTTT